VLKNAEDLKKYNKEEEDLVESIIKRIADSGVNVVIAG
jgi:chaperonin GroEL (HSP60 family)